MIKTLNWEMTEHESHIRNNVLVRNCLYCEQEIAKEDLIK